MTLKKSLPTSCALILVLLFSAFYGRHFSYSSNKSLDFICYYEAAYIIHEGHGKSLYKGADTGVNPQMRIALPSDAIGKAALELGRTEPGFFLYPPLLADLFVPLTYLPLGIAGWVWFLMNITFLCSTAYLLLDILSLRFWSLPSLAIVVGLFTMDATLMTLEIGQVTAMLLLLWVCGICTYIKHNFIASALCFALAAVLKLTPVLAVIPFLIWLELKWLRWFAIFVLSLLAVMCYLNSLAVLTDFFRHVMPSMGAGFPSFEDKSLMSAMELIYMTSHGFGISLLPEEVPKMVVFVSKLISLLLMLFASYLILRTGKKLNGPDRAHVLAVTALLSACISPVSWRHAYVLAFIALAFLWADAFRLGITAFRLTVLSICTIELTTFHLDYITLRLLRASPVSFGIASCLAPVAGLILVFLALFEMSSRIGTNGKPWKLHAA